MNAAIEIAHLAGVDGDEMLIERRVVELEPFDGNDLRRGDCRPADAGYDRVDGQIIVSGIAVQKQYADRCAIDLRGHLVPVRCCVVLRRAVADEHRIARQRRGELHHEILRCAEHRQKCIDDGAVLQSISEQSMRKAIRRD